MKLTKEQAKMVIEYFSQQAAQEAPVMDLDWKGWDSNMWLWNYKASIAIERVLNMSDWAALVNAQLDWQTFDRDPYGYLHQHGWTDSTEDWMRETLQDVLSAQIDTVFNTSKAA